MAYKFPLAAVLRLREIEEQREERLLAQIHAQIAQTKEELVTVDRQMAAVRLRRENDLREAVAAQQLHSSYALIKVLETHKANTEAHLAQCERLRERQIAQYQLAHQKKEVLSTMREDQRDAYEGSRARQEQKMLDDIFMARRLRN